MSTIEEGHFSRQVCLTGSRCPLQYEGSFRPHQFQPSKMSTIEGPLLLTGSALRRLPRPSFRYSAFLQRLHEEVRVIEDV
jgi:hypothetical protein